MSNILVPTADIRAGSWAGVSGPGVISSPVFRNRFPENAELIGTGHPLLDNFSVITATNNYLLGRTAYNTPIISAVDGRLKNTELGVAWCSENGRVSDRYVALFGGFSLGFQSVLFWVGITGSNTSIDGTYLAGSSGLSIGYTSSGWVAGVTGSARVVSITPNLPTNTACVIVLTLDSVAYSGITTAKAYLNGKLVGSNSFTNIGVFGGGLALGNSGYSEGNYSSACHIMAGYSQTKWDDAKVLSFSNNPWQIFKQTRKTHFYAPNTYLFDKIDEPTINTTDYIEATLPGTCEVALSNPYTGLGSVQTVSYVIGKGVENGYGIFKVPTTQKRQPNGAIELNAANPFTKGLHTVLTGELFKGVTRVGSSEGLVAHFTSGGSPIGPYQLGTIFLWFKSELQTAWTALIWSDTPSRMTFFHGADNTATKIVSLGGGASLNSSNLHSHIPVGKWHKMAISAKNRELKVYVNGVLKTTNTTVDGDQWTGGTLYVGGSGGAADVKIAMACNWPGKLFSDAEHAAFASNPWQLFKKSKYTQSVVANTAGNMSVSLVQGSTPTEQVIASWSHAPVDALPTRYDQILTAPQKALITAPNNLKLVFEKTS